MLGTLLLGLGRLEATGVLAVSHGSMLEDILECMNADDLVCAYDYRTAHDAFRRAHGLDVD
jgi:hypothetical protein